MTKTTPKRVQADAETTSPDKAVNDFHGQLLNDTGDMSAKLNDLADLAIKLARSTKDPNEKQRLRVLAQQIERADKAILDVGVGII